VTGEREQDDATDLGQIARDAAARISASGNATAIAAGKPGHEAIECVEIPIAAVGQYLEQLSRDLPKAGVAAASIWLQKRSSASHKARCASGITVRIPHAVDGNACAEGAGLPRPTCWWSTADRTVLVYVFSEPAELWITIAVVEEFSLAIEGAELTYRAGGAFVELPTDASVHGGGPVLDVVHHAPSLPRRLLEAVQASGLIGDGNVSDVVMLVPATWAGVEILRYATSVFSDANAPHFMNVATRAWLRAKCYAESKSKLEKLPTQDQRLDRINLQGYVTLCLKRIHGEDAAGAFNLYFDDVMHDVRLLEGDAACPLRVKSETLFNDCHHHEFASTLANETNMQPMFDKETQRHSIEVVQMCHPHTKSLGNKILIGHPGCLAALGVPRIVRHEFAAAFVRDEWKVNSVTRVVAATRAARMRRITDDQFDTLEYFLGLYKAGRIPLASESDVRRYVMALASPLLRHIAVGLLGIYWILGPPGAGKDFLAELLADIHRHATLGVASAKFTISLTNELEDKRSFYAAGPAIYGRAKEAGKRSAMVEQLIRFAGTDQLPARGMRENEIAIPNTFTWIAESAEEPPNRIEISRRTVGINCIYVDDEVSLGQVRQEILVQAPNIIADLLRKVEAQAPQWYVNQANTKSRPVVPVALAQLFGVTLDEVEGRSLDDLFEAMLIYTSNPMHSMTEGDDQRRIAIARKAKEAREAYTFKSYRLSHFVETMQSLSGYKALFSELRTAKAIELIIKREVKEYREVIRGKAPCLEVEIRGDKYAFKLARANRNFILEPLTRYLTVMNQPDAGSDSEASSVPIDLAAARVDAVSESSADEATAGA
jgi:hypothetical protein